MAWPSHLAARTAPSPARAPGHPPISLLIVDDDQLDARIVRANVELPGAVRAEVAASGEEALERLARGPIDAILTDLAMPGMDGIDLVRRVRQLDPSLPIIIMTAHATVERAVEGIRAGATDFLQKPVNIDALLVLIERAVAERPLREQLSVMRRQLAGSSAESWVFGSHPALDAARRFVEQIARVPGARVLLTGESGTGKSLAARAIHHLSGATGRLVEVNCAALPGQLLESELFGHEKGAFTDAKTMRRGLVEMADKGTLFLDEIGAMPVELQAKLLLFLESREIRRVGGATAIPVQTRVIAATNDDLRARARERTFRQDLLYRLDVASLEMPPLRAMRSVIPQLAERFVRDICGELHRPAPAMDDASFSALADYAWPGNARELRNAVERALIFHATGPLRVAPAPAAGAPAADSDPGGTDHVVLELGLTLEEVERRYLSAMLGRGERPLGELATQLGVARKTLWEKRRRYGL